MRHVIRLMAFICCALVCLKTGPALAEKRLALAVGIDVYDNLPAHEQLKKAVNDARAVGAAFRDLGFTTEVAENLARLAFARAWQRFLNRLEPGDVAALFFAGHAVEVGGLNYLLPRDVPKVELREDRLLADASIRFNALMDDLREKKARTTAPLPPIGRRTARGCRCAIDTRGAGSILATLQPASGGAEHGLSSTVFRCFVHIRHRRWRARGLEVLSA